MVDVDFVHGNKVYLDSQLMKVIRCSFLTHSILLLSLRAIFGQPPYVPVAADAASRCIVRLLVLLYLERAPYIYEFKCKNNAIRNLRWIRNRI